MSRDLTFANSPADILLISIGRCGVDMTIAIFQSGKHNVFNRRIVGLTLKGTETNGRKSASVVEFECFDCF